MIGRLSAPNRRFAVPLTNIAVFLRRCVAETGRRANNVVRRANNVFLHADCIDWGCRVGAGFLKHCTPLEDR